MYFLISIAKGKIPELTLSLSIQYDTPEVCYGDSTEIVQILDMTSNK